MHHKNAILLSDLFLVLFNFSKKTPLPYNPPLPYVSVRRHSFSYFEYGKSDSLV